MATILTLIGTAFLLVSAYSCTTAKSVIHESNGLVLLLIASVFFVGGCLADRLPKPSGHKLRCGACKEPIHSEAIKCPHCASPISQRS